MLGEKGMYQTKVEVDESGKSSQEKFDTDIGQH